MKTTPKLSISNVFTLFALLLLFFPKQVFPGHGDSEKPKKAGGHEGEKKEGAVEKPKKEGGHEGGEKKEGHGESAQNEKKEKPAPKPKKAYVSVRLPPSRKTENVSSQLSDIHTDYINRRKEIEKSETEIKAQKESMHLEVKTLNEEIEKLKKLKNEISDLLKEKSKIDKKKLEEMKSVYEKMDAKNVAAIVEKMDIDLAVILLQMMNASKSSRIVEKLTPEKAVKITELYTSFTKESKLGVINSICENYFQGYDNSEGSVNNEGPKTETKN